MSATRLLTVNEALAQILEFFSPLPPERVPLLESLDRVLAEDVRAPQDIPPFTNSAMDGYAVQSADLADASETHPRRLRVIGQIAAGDAPALSVTPGAAVRIMTGAPLPVGADAVVRFELTEPADDHVLVRAAAEVGENVRPAGEDVRAGDVAIARGTIIRPHVIGLLASLGCGEVACHRRPRVAVLATGDELVPLGEPLQPGQIRNSNEYTLAALVREAGGVPVCLGIARDNAAHLKAKLAEGLAANVDLFLTSAGVSIGDYDIVKDVLAEEGVVHFWQVAIKPGKPLAFGLMRGVPLLGLPGNPVATAVAFEAFARPAILTMLGRPRPYRVELPAVLDEEVHNSGRRHYMRAWVRRVGDTFHVATRGSGVNTQGSGIQSSLVWANCLLIVPEDVTYLPAGSLVQVQLTVDALEA
ncbi:MAG: gephyrin-like molybdotransferase Glp [Anaerolineae bacterium]